MNFDHFILKLCGKVNAFPVSLYHRQPSEPVPHYLVQDHLYSQDHEKTKVLKPFLLVLYSISVQQNPKNRKHGNMRDNLRFHNLPFFLGNVIKDGDVTSRSENLPFMQRL